MQLRSDKAFLLTCTRDTEKSMINANSSTRERRFETRFESRFDCGYWNEFLKRKIYSQGAIWYAFEPETRFCRDDKRKVVLKRLYNVSQKKTEPWNNGQKLSDVLLLSYLFNEVWLICFRMIHNWNSSNHASLSSIVFKIECQKPVCATFRYTCRQGYCYNPSPMWPSLDFKPFSTKKQHGFVYMMIKKKIILITYYHFQAVSPVITGTNRQ